MKHQLWRRLDAVQGKFAPENYLITVAQRPGESLETVDARLQRWRDGEKDRDIRGVPTEGEELVVILRSFAEQE